MIPRTVPFLAMMLFSFATLPQSALAYIDPGAGSYMIQLLAAGAISALFAVKVFWGRIKDFFKGRSDKEGDG
ncbi:MAG: hypothetical protein V1792_02435 [Pseudomonadota bacterium]